MEDGDPNGRVGLREDDVTDTQLCPQQPVQPHLYLAITSLPPPPRPRDKKSRLLILLKFIFHFSHEKLQSQAIVTTLQSPGKLKSFLLQVELLAWHAAFCLPRLLVQSVDSTMREKALPGCLLWSTGLDKWSS